MDHRLHRRPCSCSSGSGITAAPPPFPLLLLLVLVLTAASQVQFAAGFSHLDYTRSTQEAERRNVLSLRCTNSANDEPIRNAVFYLNQTLFFDLNHPETNDPDRLVPRVRAVEGGTRIMFVLTREAEGNFFCGVGDDLSEPRAFVALPVMPAPPSPPLPTPPSFKVNSQARVKCPQRPGALRESYYIAWLNASSGERLAEIPNPFQPPQYLDILNPRHSVDPVTYDLVIDNVTLLDSAVLYRCVLSVLDVQEGRIYIYETSDDLELLVYVPPVISTPPEPSVIAVSANPSIINFRCSALGSETPVVKWYHGDDEVDPTSSSDSNKYLVSPTPFGTAGGEQGMTSTLTILGLRAQDTGTVNCSVYTPRSATTDNRELPGDSVSVPLTVLDEYSKLLVFTTTTRDIIFSVTFPITPLHPVQLHILYFEVGGADKNSSVAPPIFFTNESVLDYIAFDVAVPFDKFQVEISLLCDGVMGPGRNDMLVFDKDHPSEIQHVIEAVTIPGVTATIIVGALIILIMSLVFGYCFLRHRQRSSSERRERLDTARMEKQKSDRLNAAMQDIRKEFHSGRNSEETKLRLLDFWEDLVKTFCAVNSQEPPPSLPSSHAAPDDGSDEVTSVHKSVPLGATPKPHHSPSPSPSPPPPLSLVDGVEKIPLSRVDIDSSLPESLKKEDLPPVTSPFPSSSSSSSSTPATAGQNSNNMSSELADAFVRVTNCMAQMGLQHGIVKRQMKEKLDRTLQES